MTCFHVKQYKTGYHGYYELVRCNESPIENSEFCKRHDAYPELTKEMDVLLNELLLEDPDTKVTVMKKNAKTKVSGGWFGGSRINKKIEEHGLKGKIKLLDK